MSKRKADSLAQLRLENGPKKAKHADSLPDVPPTFGTSGLLDNSDSSGDESTGGVKLDGGFKINEEYAKRFEHNKKREELHRLEEKYQKPAQSVKGQYGDKYDEDSDSSSDEEEDDDGFLATEALDAEISATLQAIRSKDPRVYDEKSQFYAPIEEDGNADVKTTNPKKEKPMYLSDYHRENLLKGHNSGSLDQDNAPRTFVEEQEDMRKSIVKEMHAAAEGNEEDSDEDGGFLVRKSESGTTSLGLHPSRAGNIEVDIATADKDPETFLSNFMVARAWLPSEGSRFQPFESDDEEEEERAERFEAAYNLRFEDPKGSNEMLKSYARDVIAAKSVRREEPNARKKARDAKREKQEAEKREREEERAQLRKLKIEEMQQKVQKIKKASGIRGQTLNDEDWAAFLNDGWNDQTWETEMKKRFGEEYYAEMEGASSSDEGGDVEGKTKKKKKPRKPKWDDDIDINDLIPDFVDEEDVSINPAFTLSDIEDDEENSKSAKKLKTKKDRQQERIEAKEVARIERKKIEDLVDSKLDFDDPILPGKSTRQTTFRYRETSPTSFGLTARDILMADDSALNQFAGLKKMATFRDAEKKRKDKKHLGKKARLRQWRKETFGNEEEPTFLLGNNDSSKPDGDGEVGGEPGIDVVEGKRKKKRSRMSKGQDV